MRRFKVLLTSLIVCMLLIVNNIYAQTPDKMPEPKVLAEQETEVLKKELNLSEEQVKKIAVINLKYAEKRKEIIEEAMNQGDWVGMREKMEPLTKAKTEEIKPVLTDAQFTEYPKVMQKLRMRFNKRQ